jgi:uncharacterized low-complexity protein
MIWVLCAVLTAPLFLFGCEAPDELGSLEDDLLVDNATQVATVCNFGTSEINVGKTYSVTLQSKELKVGKPYLVEVVQGGNKQTPTGQIKTNGIMVVSVAPSMAGAGTLSVYETKTKKTVVTKTLKAQCAFNAHPSDLCPNDPAKTAPGKCGCGVADTDSDKDGAPNCKDGCPNDPTKVAPGQCGCGVPEGTCGSDDGQQTGGCQICPPGTPVYDSPVCTHIVNAAPNFKQGSEDCRSIVSMANSSGCCGNGPPDPCDFEPPKVDYVGPYPACDLCRDGDYPNNTSMVINVLYLGAASCAQYYKYGLQGRIPTHMCDTIQYFAYEPCGCGEFNIRENQCKERD